MNNSRHFNDFGHETINNINNIGHRLFGNICDIIQPVLSNVSIRVNDLNKAFIQCERYDTLDNVYLLCLIPGVEKANISLCLNNGKVTISAKTSINNTTDWTHSNEKTYYREFDVPIETTSQNLKAFYNNGALKLIISKPLVVDSVASNIPIN